MYKKTILGVDCGGNGALVYYDGVELIPHRMPVFEIKKGKSIRKRVDFRGVCNILKTDKPDHAYVENVSAQFGNGAAQAFSFGRACEAIENALIACNVPYSMVTPQEWKRAMKCPAEKDGARMRASQLLPDWSHCWDKKCLDGVAEAAMIALYGYNKTTP
jgi:crossover junction endodeoxyribonuclease RuvC